MKDTDPDKRAKLVDGLIASRDFTRFWQIKLGDLLEITTARPDLGNVPAINYQSWLAKRLIANAPWDGMVRELLTSLGDPNDRDTGGPVAYALEGASTPRSRPRRPPNASWACGSAAPSATTTPSTSGPRTIISAWPPPSPRSSAPAAGRGG